MIFKVYRSKVAHYGEVQVFAFLTIEEAMSPYWNFFGVRVHEMDVGPEKFAEIERRAPQRIGIAYAKYIKASELHIPKKGVLL